MTTHTPEFRDKVREIISKAPVNMDTANGRRRGTTIGDLIAAEFLEMAMDYIFPEIENLLVEMIDSKRKTYGTYEGGAIYNQALDDLLAMIRPGKKA